jgi:hypothetical protein
VGKNYCLKELDIKFTRKTNNWEPTFEIMVPLSAWTCRNLGVLANAQTRRVQSDVQSGRYSAPISNACDRSVLLSGFTNPDSTKTTPSCPDIQNHHMYTWTRNSIHLNVEWPIDKYQKFGEIRPFLSLLGGACMFLLAWIVLSIFRRTHPRREASFGHWKDKKHPLLGFNLKSYMAGADPA